MTVCVAIIAYEASTTIERVLDRIPLSVGGSAPVVLVADDHSLDDTAALSRAWGARSDLEVHVVVQPRNLGYGGNQKAAYRWAHEHGFAVVAMVHGDGQYPPEQLDDLVGPILDGDADMVFGSRMMIVGGARRGGMPLVRLVGNRALTRVLNTASHASFTEWFSGYRAYRTDVLDQAGIDSLADGFDFDTEITLHLLERGARPVEVAIPTRYADEECRVPLLRTGLQAVRHAAVYRVRRRGDGSGPHSRSGASPLAPLLVDPEPRAERT